MHPNRFFDECGIRTGIDTIEIFDEEFIKQYKEFIKENNRHGN